MKVNRLVPGLAISALLVVGTAVPARAADKYCSKLKSFKSDFEKLEAKTDSADPSTTKGLNQLVDAFNELAKGFKKLEADVPSKIKGDIVFASSTFQDVAKEFSKIKGAKLTDLEKLAKRLETAGKKLDDPKFDKAGDNISAWSKKNCPGLNLDLGS